MFYWVTILYIVSDLINEWTGYKRVYVCACAMCKDNTYNGMKSFVINKHITDALRWDDVCIHDGGMGLLLSLMCN